MNDQLRQLTDDYQPVVDAVDETAEGVVAALQLAADEVKNGLDRISKLL